MSGMIGVLRTVIMIIVLIGAGAGILLIVFDGKLQNIKQVKDKAMRKVGKSTPNANNKKKDEKSNKTNKEKINTGYTQDFLDFDDIQAYSKEEPIGVIVRNNKTEFIGVIEVQGINYNLLSVEERLRLESSFATLLNGIDFPIQIYIQSNVLDIEHYKKKYETNLENIKKNIERLQRRSEILKKDEGNPDYAEIEKIDKNLSRLINQYNYGVQIYNYIVGRCMEKTMLNRKYHIVVSHTHNTKLFSEQLTYDELLNNAFNDINNKANSIIAALNRGRLDGNLLTNVELAQLLYVAYNKFDSSSYKLKNALESRFSNFYTTGEEIDVKIARKRLEDLEEMESEVEINMQDKVGA